MMVVYKTPSKEIQEIILASVTYETVIDGLNGYFASEPRNDYITVKMVSNDRDSALYEAEAWADILITWLRTEHGIFYYPGMETRYAKMEKIPPFTKRMMNEGALNSLKKLYKNITGEEDETSSPTLMASTVSCNFSNKDRMISVLKEQNELLKGEVRQLNRDYIMNCIRQEPSQNGFDLPRACQDLIEDLKKRDAEIKELKERIAELESNFKAVCDEDDIFRTRALKAEEEIELLKGEVRQLNSEHIAALDGIKILNAELATKWTKTSLINWLQQRARHKGVELDDAFLYSDDVQYEWTDIVDFLFDEIVKMRGEIENLTETSCKDIEDGGRSCCGIGFDPSTYKTDYMPRSTYEAKKEAFLKALDEPYDEEEELP